MLVVGGPWHCVRRQKHHHQTLLDRRQGLQQEPHQQPRGTREARSDDEKSNSRSNATPRDAAWERAGPKALPVDTPRASRRTAPAVCALALDPCVVVGKLMFWRRLGGIEPATTMKHGCWRSLSKAGAVPRHRRSYPMTPMFQDKKVPERPCSKMCHCWCRIARIHGLALCGRYGACNFSIHRSSRPRVAKGPFLFISSPQ